MATQEPYADADLSVLTSMPNPGRPWQLELTGDLDRLASDKRTDAILTRLLDYMPNLSSIEIRADQHQVVVRRVFSSDKSGSVDALIAAFFKAVPAAKGITFHKGEESHSVTPEASFDPKSREADSRERDGD